MKKLFALLLSLAMVMALVAGCSPKQETPTTPTDEPKVASAFLGGGTPLTMDPALNSASVGGNIIRLAQCGLMGYQLVDGKAELLPELAESYKLSDDKLTYTFTLRDGLKWSDGSDFKTSEMVASWNRAASADLGADYGYLFDIIEGYPDAMNIVADDAARTLTVKLKSPTPYFLELCAFTTFYAVKTENADAEGAWAVDPATYVGMGPFKMTEFKVDDVANFEKNEYYWNAANVKLGGVKYYLSEDNVAILTAYENDTADYIDQSIDPTEFDRLNETYPGELVFGDLIGTWYVLFNVHKDVSPLGKQLSVQDQSKARFALGQLINRAELVEEVTQAGQVPATGFYPKSLGDGQSADVRSAPGYGAWYTGTSTPSTANAAYTEDQVAACQTLIDLGYAYTGSIATGDIKFTDVPAIDFAFNNAGANALVIQYVQQTWNTFGITATINTEAWATLQQKLKAGDAEAARMGWVADFNDCVNFLEIFISNSGNNYPRLGKAIGDYTRASDVTKDAGVGAYWGPDGNQTWADAYDALVAEIKATADPAKRAELCAKAEDILMDTGAVAPMYFYTKPNMMKPRVHDLIQLPSGDVIWNYATID